MVARSEIVTTGMTMAKSISVSSLFERPAA